MIKHGEIGPKPVAYLVFAWIQGIGTMLLTVPIVVVIVVAYSGQFGGPFLQQAFLGIFFALFVALTQLFLAQTACFAILHSRSQRTLIGTAIGTGYIDQNSFNGRPFETTDRSRFWVDMYRSGWRVFIAIYAVVLAIIVSSATQNALPALPLVVLAVALGVWHASYVPQRRAKELAKKAEEEEENLRTDKELDAKQLILERQFARADGVSLTDEWIERELKRVFTAKTIRAVQGGDLAALDKPVRRAYRAMNERVPLDQLHERALQWVTRQ